jgi:hypothetical protein
MYGAIMHRDIYHLKDGVWCKPFIPEWNTVKDMLKPFTKKFRKLAFSAEPCDVEEYPYRYYKGRRLVKYVEASKNYLSKGIRRNFALVSMFLKMEKNELKSERQLEFNGVVDLKLAVPRLVKPRPAEFNVAVGVYLRPLEAPIYEIISEVFNESRCPVVMKGYDAFTQARHIRTAWDMVGDYGPVCAVGLDASKFDQHVNEQLLRYEHTLYKMFYPGDKKLKELLCMQLHNKIRARIPPGQDTEECTLSYTTAGGRCSGDMNTALGNCAIMCAGVYSMLTSVPKTNWQLINNGDDCVIFVTRNYLQIVIDSIVPFFSALGIEMKVEAPVYDFERVEFCQTHPIWDGNMWRMVRNINTSLSKDACIIKDISNASVYPRYLKSLSDCGLSLTYGMPILQSYYSAMARASSGDPLTDPSMESGMMQLAHGLKPKCAPITDQARISFDIAFGIPPNYQLDLERYYDTVDLTWAEACGREPANGPYAC